MKPSPKTNLNSPMLPNNIKLNVIHPKEEEKNEPPINRPVQQITPQSQARLPSPQPSSVMRQPPQPAPVMRQPPQPAPAMLQSPQPAPVARQSPTQAQPRSPANLQSAKPKLIFGPKTSFNRKKTRGKMERAPTIPEDEDESLISSYQTSNRNLPKVGADPRHRLAKHPSTISDQNINENDMVPTDNSLPKQATPVPDRKRLNEEALDVSFPESPEKNVKNLHKDFDKEERPLDVSDNNVATPKVETATPKVETTTPVIIDEDDIKTPAQLLQYFKSKDPDPKRVAPVGGSGPTLTKTLVKRPKTEPVTLYKADESKEEEKKDATYKDEPPLAPVDEDPEVAELRKLEEEVAQLEKEAKETLLKQGENPGEISIIDEQTIMVDGKRKRKKRKKRKRKKVGGGEETIANITIDEVSLDGEGDEEEHNGIKLNPPRKKKVKKHKNKATALNTVEEDSKEQSYMTDYIKKGTLDSQQLSETEIKEEVKQEPSKPKIPEKSTFSSTKLKLQQDEDVSPMADKVEKFEPIETPKLNDEWDANEVKVEKDDLPVVSEKLDSPKNAQSKWKFPEDEGIVPDFSEDDESKRKVTPNEDTDPEPFTKVLNPIAPGLANKKILDLPREESPEKPVGGLMYLQQEQDLSDKPVDTKTEHEKPLPASGTATPVRMLTESNEKSTEDQSMITKNFPKNRMIGKRSQLDKVESKSEIQKVPTFPRNEMNQDIQGFGGAISLLPLNCETHRQEYIKYFCRDDDCKVGLCPECLIEHEGHDYIYADEIASFEIKQALKATITECSYKVKSQNMLFNETQKLAQYIEDLKAQEYEKIHYYFMDLHKELDKREKKLKERYHEQVKDVESILKKDISILDKRMREFEDISIKLKEKSNRFRMSNDLAIVANAYEVFDLQRKIKNNNFEGKRLELDDEDIEASQQLEDSPDDYNYRPKAKSPYTNVQKKPSNLMEENLGEHVFFVQLDSELPMPHFLINISKEKKKIESIGSIKSSFLSNQDLVEPPLDSERSKHASEAEIRSPYKHKLMPFAKPNAHMKQFLGNYNGLMRSNSHSNLQAPDNDMNVYNAGYNSRVVDPNDVQPAPPQQSVTITEQTMIKSDAFVGREMYWFKWDSFESWKYSFGDDTWSLIDEAKPPHKFLYFSNTVHLKNKAGCFLLGGCDFEDNYSKRALHFENYLNFREKAPMINTRAFFTSCYSQIDNSIYVFGGNDNVDDLSLCEKYSITENVWRQISPLNYKRNGASSCFIEEANFVFVFGGNNKELGSLDSIEKYSIDFDKWTVINAKLREPLHDLTSIYLGASKIMILGGNNEEGVSKSVEIKDLADETNKIELKHGGKCYFSPMIDEEGQLHCFFGYGDTQLIHENFDIKSHLQPPLTFKYKNTVKKDLPPQVPNRIPRPLQKTNQSFQHNSNSQGRILPRANPPIDFHYNPPRDVSHSYLQNSEHASPPHMYPYKKSKIRSIKAYYNQNVDEEHHDSFFHKRNTPKNQFKKFDAFASPSASKHERLDTLVRTDPAMSHKFPSGLHSLYNSSRN